jgi:hypothetical protein
MTSETQSGAELIAALEQVGEEFARFVEGLPPEAFHRRPGPDEWSAAEVTGHVSEAPVTFATHASRVAETPGAAVGRPPEDPNRLAAVARLGDAGPNEGARLVRDGIREAADILRGIPAAGWQARGKHPRLGEPTVALMV